LKKRRREAEHNRADQGIHYTQRSEEDELPRKFQALGFCLREGRRLWRYKEVRIGERYHRGLPGGGLGKGGQKAQHAEQPDRGGVLATEGIGAVALRLLSSTNEFRRKKTSEVDPARRGNKQKKSKVVTKTRRWEGSDKVPDPF